MGTQVNRVSRSGGGVFVTGASSGIGLETCRQLAGRGFRTFGTVRKKQDGAALEAAGAIPLILDVTDRASIAAARQETTRILNGAPLIGVVNNAGISGAAPVEVADLEEFRQMFEVNALGAVSVTQEFLPLLKASRGRIVNISSVSGWFAGPFMAPYAASKFALEAISDCLRRELYPFGIDVVVIQPGIVHTPIWKKGAARDLSLVKNTRYEEAVTRMRDYAASVDERAIPASRVSCAIIAALTARRPPARILVVPNRFLHRLRRLVPERIRDRRIARRLWGTRQDG